MLQKKQKIRFVLLSFFCIILYMVLTGNISCLALQESKAGETDDVLEQILEIPMTEEQFQKVNYYHAPQFQTRAVTKNSYDSEYGFSLLSDSEKKVYKRLEQACEQFQNSDQNAQVIDDEYVSVGIELEAGELSKERIAYVVVGFIYDHPQYFWTKGYSYWIGRESDAVRKIVLACDENYLNGSERLKLWEKMQKNIESYLDGVMGVKDDYSRELTLHDTLAKNLSYAYASSGRAETKKWAHNIEGAFSGEYNKVVCEGYAKAFQLLLNAAGIENIYIVGNGKTGGSWQGHAWNQVKIEKEWYLVDLTWNDGSVISHRYFNLDENTFSSNHVPYKQTDFKVARWCYELETANGIQYSFENQRDVIRDQFYQISYQMPEQFDFTLYNKGVEVSNGSEVQAGTKLDFILTPKEENVLFDGTLTVGEKQWDFLEYRGNYTGSFHMENQNRNITMVCTGYMPVKEILNDVKVNKTINIKKKKSKTIVIKKPKQLRKYKITFVSNNKKIAEVTEKGKVKGKKKGSAVVTVKIVDSYGNKKNFKVKVIVK